MFFAPVLMQRMEDYFLKQSQSEWLGEANTISAKVVEGGYLKDHTSYTYLDSLVMEWSKEWSTQKPFGSRIVIVDGQGYVIIDSAKADLNKTILSKQVFDALNKEDTAQYYERNEQKIMSAATPIVDKDNKDQVLGVVVVSANIHFLVKLSISNFLNKLHQEFKRSSNK